MTDEFYDQIEEPIRDLVRKLRDNGINTICSCGHKMYIQADVAPDSFLQTMHKTTYCWLIEEKGMPEPNYTVDIHLSVTRGIVQQCFAEIKIQR